MFHNYDCFESRDEDTKNAFQEITQNLSITDNMSMNQFDIDSR